MLDDLFKSPRPNTLIVRSGLIKLKVNHDLKACLAEIGPQPGCYLFLNARNQILYVGKAKHLRKRVSSYFRNSQNHRTATLLSETDSIKTFICASEKEALILEYNLIKSHHPKFNVLLKDDKRFPYIVVSRERHPRYLYTRRPLKKALFYYGPLPDGSKARQLMQILQEIIPLRRCKNFTGKPCFYFQLGRCLGACFRDVSPAKYERQLGKVKAFFVHKDQTIERALRRRMNIAAHKLQFEQASKIKHLIQRLDWIRSDQQVQLNKMLDADFVSCYQGQDRIIFLVLFYRQGCLIHKTFSIFRHDHNGIDGLARMFLLNLYAHNPLPTAIIVDDRLSQPDLRLLFFDRIRLAQSNLETKILQLAHQNAVTALAVPANLALVDNHRFELEQLRQLCGVSHELYRIEMFDVSSWADQLVVGSCAVFKNGWFNRHQSRCYRTKISGNDDYAATGEIIAKHYAHQVRVDAPLPDLVIVDGGWAHVQTVQHVLRRMEVNLLVVGLSKNDRHQTEQLVTGDRRRIKLRSYPRLWRWLSHLQITTHNLGVNYFHKVKISKLKTNLLVQCKGISEQKAQQLYAQFHDLPTMARSDFQQLNKIINNQTVTRRLMGFFRQQFGDNR